MNVSEMTLPPTGSFRLSVVDGSAPVDALLALHKAIDVPHINRAMEVNLRRSVSPAAAGNVT